MYETESPLTVTALAHCTCPKSSPEIRQRTCASHSSNLAKQILQRLDTFRQTVTATRGVPAPEPCPVDERNIALVANVRTW